MTKPTESTEETVQHGETQQRSPRYRIIAALALALMALTSCARDPAPPPAATAAGAPNVYLDYSGKDDALTGGVR